MLWLDQFDRSKKSIKAPNPPTATIGHRKFLRVSIESMLPIHRQRFLIVSHRNRSSTMIWQDRSPCVSARRTDCRRFYGDKLRGEAVSLLEAEASQPRDVGNRHADDHHPLMPRRNPEDIDLGAIKADLEFLIERTERRTALETAPIVLPSGLGPLGS